MIGTDALRYSARCQRHLRSARVSCSTALHQSRASIAGVMAAVIAAGCQYVCDPYVVTLHHTIVLPINTICGYTLYNQLAITRNCGYA